MTSFLIRSAHRHRGRGSAAAGVDGAFAVAGLAWPDQRPAPGLGQPHPRAVGDPVVQRVLEAGMMDRAAVADDDGGVRLLDGALAAGEPQLGSSPWHSGSVARGPGS